MYRASLEALTDKLRRMIQDTDSPSVWSTDDLADALDNHRREARYAQLRDIETIAAGGSVVYKDFAADVGNWEGAVVLVDSSFNVLSAGITADLHTGRWTFADAPNRPVRVTGWYYDLYGAAVEILDAWILKERSCFDFSADQRTFRRSQKVDRLVELADRYRAQMWVDSTTIISGDINGNADGF